MRRFIAVMAVVLCASTFIFANSVLPIPNTNGVTTTGAPGFGTESWAAGGAAKAEFYTTPELLFGHGITVGDIASMSYWTNKTTDAGAPDWSLYIYTAKTGTGDHGWYHDRLIAEPYYAANTSGYTAGDWNEWSTGTGANEMMWYDFAHSYGAYATNFDWSNLPTGVNTQTVLYISLQTGSGWANGFTGKVDGLTINLNDGETGSVDMVATPEPASLALMGSGLLGFAGFARRRLMR